MHQAVTTAEVALLRLLANQWPVETPLGQIALELPEDDRAALVARFGDVPLAALI